MALTVAQLVARVTADTSGFYKSMAVMNSSLVRTGSVAGRIFAGAGLAVTAFGILSLKAAGDFQQSMNMLKAVAEPTTNQFKAMRKEAIDLGNDLRLPAVNAKDAADVMYDLSRSGLTVNQTMKATRGVLMMATAANIPFADAALATARALKAFNLPGEQANKIADLMAATVNRTTASVQDLTDGWQNAAPQFTSAGYDISTLTTALAELVDKGMSGAMAGTGLKVMLQRLESPTKKAAAVMNDLGIKIYDAQGKMKPFPDIIAQFAGALNNASEKTRNQALNTIFGQRANQGMILLMKGGIQTWDQYRKKIDESGVAQKIADARMQGFNGSLEKFKNAISTLAIELGTSLLPVATDIVNWGAKFVQGLDVGQIQSAFATLKNVIVTTFNVIRPVFTFFLTNPFGNSFIMMATGIYIAVRALTALRAAMIATKAAMTVFGSSFSTGSLLIAGITLSITAAAGAFMLLKGALGSLDNETVRLYTADAAVKALTTSIDGLKSAMDNLTNAHLGLKESQVQLLSAQVQLTQATNVWHDAVARHITKTVEGRQAYANYRQAVVGVERAQQQVKQATDTLTQAQNKNQTTLRGGIGAIKAATGAIQDNVIKLMDGTFKSDQFKAATEKLTGKIDANAAAHIRLARELNNTNPAAARTQLSIARYGIAMAEAIKKNQGFSTAGIQGELKKIPWNKFVQDMLGIAPKGKQAGDNTAKNLKAGLSKMPGEAGAKAKATKTAVVGPLNQTAAGARAAGSAAGSGFVSALAAYIGPAAATAAAIASAAKNAMNTTLQTGSDSKVTTKIGEDTAAGFINGFVRYYKENEPKLKQPMVKALLLWKSIEPQAKAAAKIIGTGQVQEIINGIIGKEPSLRQQMIKAMKDATDAAIQSAKEEVANKKSELESAFSALASAALAAFDAQVAKWQPMAQKLLDKINLKDTIDQLQGVLGDPIMNLYQMIVDQINNGNLKAADALTQNLVGMIQSAVAAAQTDLTNATSALAAAQAAFDAVQNDPNATDEQKKAAQDALDAAKTAYDTDKQRLDDLLQAREKILTLIAQQEKTKYDQMQETRRAQFEQQLTQLNKALEEHRITYETYHKKILALFKKYIPGFRLSGKAIGEAIAQGLRDAIGDVEAAAKDLAEAIKKYLKLSSPAEVGPLSDLDKWWKTFAPTLLEGLDIKPIVSTVNNLAMGPPATMPLPPTTNTGGVTYFDVTLQAPAIIGNNLDNAARELTPLVRRVFIDIAKSNGFG